MKKSLLGFCAVLLLAMPARAQELPQFVLDESYRKCMGSETPASNPQRDAYCACVEQGLRGWDVDSYVAAAQKSLQDPSNKLNQLAQSCIAKVVRQ